MEAIVLKIKKTREGNIKATVRCNYCSNVNTHGSDRSGIYSRQCDGLRCHKENLVKF